MHPRKAGIVAAAIIASLIGLSGCTGDGDDTGGKTELKVWLPTQEAAQKAALTTIIDGFEKANPDIKITTEERAIDPYKDALRQVAGTPAGPDVYWYWEGPGLSGELVDAGMSMDLTSYYESYGWEDRFSEAALTGIKQYEGFHGVPWTQQGQALYYNKTLFAKAGITEPPTTYDELTAAADKLVAAGITPIEFGGTVNWHVMRLLDALLETKCGAKLHDELTATKASWAGQSCVDESFTELKKWATSYFNEGYMGISNDDSSQLFFTGDVAMAFEGTWFDAQVVDNGMDAAELGIFTFPTGTERLYGFGEAYYINANTEHGDAAAKFLDYATDTVAQEAAVGAWSALSINEKVSPSTENPLHALWQPIFAESTGLYMNNDQNLSLDQTTEFWRIQNSVLTGDLAPDRAGADFQKFIDANS